jgi:ABC-2 type transport system permease protein
MTSMTLVHARYQFLTTARIPIALIATAFFPAVSMLFFVVPNAGTDVGNAVLATSAMVVFAVMISNLFGLGIGVSEDREKAWDPYLRTLPVGPAPRFLGRIATGTAMMYIAVVPVIIIAALFTPATVTPARLLLGLLVIPVIAIPFTLLGLTVGYLLSNKAALAVVQILFLPMAFAGGLLSDPDTAPALIRTVAPYVPTRGAVEIMWAALGQRSADPRAVVALLVWTAVLAVTATLAYRRDQGVRYR